MNSLAGQTFGHLTVLGVDGERSSTDNITTKTYWICQCDCENHTIKSVRGDHLTRNEIVSCGCDKKGKTGRKPINLAGQKFGRLTALERCPSHGSSQSVYWTCKCDCGNYVEVSGARLRSGETKSCGCLKHDVLSELFTEIGKKRASDIIGKKFGHLTVLKDSGKRCCEAIVWECSCDCGNPNHVFVATNNLKSGHTQSCGCIGSSINEDKIKELLVAQNIFFTTQYRININNVSYYFDFMVDNKYFIEFDGEQHFIFNNKGWITEDKFNRTHRNDTLKNEYCFSHHIPLIRIPYNEEYTIDDLKLETTRFLLTPDKVEQYYNRS